MQDKLEIEMGKDEDAFVVRIVPGRLVYVTTKDLPSEMYSFKLDQLVIREPGGACRPYRGEPLSDLGLEEGSKVIVWGVRYQDVKPTLVIDAGHRRKFAINIGSSIATALDVLKHR